MKTNWPFWSALAALILFAFIGHLYFGYETDELTHLHQAWDIGQGLFPYRDFYIVHLPLYHYALAPFVAHLSGSAHPALAPLRLASLAIAIACASILYFLVKRRISTQPAAWCVAIWILTAPFDTVGLEIRPDMAALGCLLGSVTLLSQLTEKGRIRPVFKGAFAGILVGVASCLTQKAIILAIGMVFWIAGVFIFSPRESRSERALALASFLAGLAIPIGLLVLFLQKNNALRPMFEFTLVYPFRIRHVPPWRHTIQESLIAAFPFYVLAFAEVGMIARNAKRHLAEATFASLTATILFIGALAQIKTTAPTRQWMLMSVTPWMAVLSARALARYVESPHTIPAERRWLIGAAALCTMGCFWHNGAPTVAIWGVASWLVYRILNGEKPLATKQTIALCSLLSINFLMLVVHAIDGIRLHQGSDQRKLMEFIAEKVPDAKPVVQVWPTIAPFNRDAAFFWYAYDDTVHDMPKDEIQAGLMGALDTGKAEYAAVNPNTVRNGLPRFYDYLQSKCSRLPGTPVTRHNLEVYKRSN